MISSEEQAIVISFDKNYYNYARVLIRQLSKFTPGGISIFLMTPAHDSVAGIIEEFSNSNRLLVHITVEYEEYEKILPEVSHLTISMYARLFIPKLLPDTITQSFYIDIDVLIRRDISELFSERLEGIVGAVAANSEFPHLSVKIPKENTFYAGMLVINHIRWESEKILDRCLSIAKSGNENLAYPDNDLLVLVLNQTEENCWERIPIEYNYMAFLEKSRKTRVPDPSIVHFPGASKPWNSPYGGKYAREWRRVAHQTKGIHRLKPGDYSRYLLQDIKEEIMKSLITLVGMFRSRP